MFKTVLAVIGACFVVYEAASAWNRHCQNKWRTHYRDERRRERSEDKAAA